MTPVRKVVCDQESTSNQLQEKYPLWYHMPVQNGMGSPTLDFNPIILELKGLSN